jgi:hypothetical protein
MTSLVFEIRGSREPFGTLSGKVIVGASRRFGRFGCGTDLTDSDRLELPVLCRTDSTALVVLVGEFLEQLRKETDTVDTVVVRRYRIDRGRHVLDNVRLEIQQFTRSQLLVRCAVLVVPVLVFRL